MGTGRTIHFYWSKLNPQRLTAARELRGLTKKALADSIGKTSSAITQFEAGTSGLDIQTFEAIVDVLQLPPAFFILREGYSLNLGSCHFRAKRDVSQTLRRQAKGYAERVLNIFWALERMGVQFPGSSLPTIQAPSHYSPGEIDEAAISTRKDWGLGLGPINNMAQLLESKGVFIVLLPNEYKGIDAFSDWPTDERPCIVAVGESKPSRLQFDYGPELAHLLFHKDTPTGERETERIANRFSGAFLMPSATIGKYCPTIWSLRSFLDVKREWYVSIQAAMYRARELGRLSERAHQRGMIFLRERQLHNDEPGEFNSPYPLMLTEALELVAGEITLAELAEDIGLDVVELEKILIVQQVPQTTIEKFKPKPVRAKVTRFSPRSAS